MPVNIMSDLHKNKHHPPETVTSIENPSKRNIVRKGKPGKYRKEKVSGTLLDDDSSLPSIAFSEDDPSYDPNANLEDLLMEELINHSTSSFSIRNHKIATAKLTLTQYKKTIEKIIQEFFVNGDYEDFFNSIQEIDCASYGYELVKRCISMSFDKCDRERELTSKMLSYSYPNILSSSMIGKGFERLFEIIDEVKIDVLNADEMLTKFLSRAVVDEILPPAYLNDPVVMNLGGEIVEYAKRLLSREHAGAKLEVCWGPGDGRPVRELKIAIDQIIEEFIVSDDLQEVSRCIHELNVVFYHHEIVKRAIMTAIDKSTEIQNRISKLFINLFQEGLVKSEQFIIGFNRLYKMIDDITLDTPDASNILEEFTSHAKESGILPSHYRE